MNADNILFRCSSLGYIMTEPREKAKKERGELSETTITHLVDKFVSVKYNRETDIQNRYVTKGLAVEEDSVTLYSRLKKRYFIKNSENIANQFICGTPDLYEGENIHKAIHIHELKSSWDIFTFYRARTKMIDKHYWWQCQGYMALTGAEVSTLAYCLINTPAPLIYDEQRKLQWKMGVVNPETNKDYQDACNEIEKNMVYDDIPLNERMFEIQINRDDKAIQLLYERIKKCREYMNNHFFIPEPEEIDLAA